MADEITGGDFFPTVVLPADVAALQVALKADYLQVRSSLVRCVNAKKFGPDETPSQWDEWQALRARVDSYLEESPSFLDSKAQLARGEVLQTEIAAWHDKAKALGCDIAASTPGTGVPGGANESSIFNFGTGIGTGMLLLVLLMLWKGKM